MEREWEIGTRNLETIEGKESGCLIGDRTWSGDLGMKGVGDIREILEIEGWRTPGYIVREKMQREKLKEKAVKGTWKIEQKF